MRRVRTRDFLLYINYSLFIVGNGKNYHNAVGPVSVLTIPDNVGWKDSWFGLFAKYFGKNLLADFKRQQRPKIFGQNSENPIIVAQDFIGKREGANWRLRMIFPNYPCENDIFFKQ